MSNTESAVSSIETLREKDALRDLISTYCYRIAAADVEGVLELFAQDCVVDILGTRYEGHAGLRELYRSSLEVEPKPFVHNHLIEIDGADAAHGRAVFEIRQQRDKAAETSIGCYVDQYTKQGGTWKFQARTFAFY